MANARKTGLGKGLNALFSSGIEENKNDIGNFNDNEELGDFQGRILNLKINEVEPNKNQPRKSFNEESIEELAESIKQYGLIQPIIVTKEEGYYAIVAGERRWRASKKAGLKEIPAIIRENDARKNTEIALIENIQREDLNPIDKAMGIKCLMEDYELTQAEVAKILGKSRSAITNAIRILNLDSRVLDMVRAGKLSEGHCRALLSIPDGDKQYDMALRLLETGASVRETEKKTQLKKKLKKKDTQYEAIYRDVEDSFKSFFGTKVKLDAGVKKGKIVIEYKSNEDLERILELIKV
jgi:ParB family chromosome partitioning protein